ncbi:tetratricopeptide repeat protein [Microbulbifer halophilus]|uniref:Tetratricopeptide repeat protein n=1 Tax=Microbulbifer halophilus TaxID=453963 RepID=A0ABW5E711_9GAMM|nr:tetratricopeptide repeat protein [Microbulbifer halophilus]MCW8125897.1 tetratricopeptide repeat protein [Microbulbifer halophilus]
MSEKSEITGGDRFARDDIRRGLVMTFSALTAVVLLGLFGTRDSAAPQPPSAGAAHALAVLPVKLSGLSGDTDWLEDGGQLLLNQSLRDLRKIRVLQPGDVNRALQLFQQTYPGADDRQAAKVARLMGADYLLAARVFPVRDNYRVVLKLRSLHAPNRAAQTLADQRLAADALPAFFQRAGTLVGDALQIDGTSGREVPLWTADAQRFASAKEAYRLGQLQRARDAADQLVRSQPDYGPGWLLRARIASDQGDTAEAEASLQHTVAASRPDSATAYWAQALSARWRGDADAAETFLHRLIETFPGRTRARMELAALQMEQGLFEEALVELQKVVVLDPKHARAWLELSKAAIVSGRGQRALDEYLPRALEAHERLRDLSGRGDVLNAYGVAHQRLGQLQQARDYYVRGLEQRRAEGDRRGQVTSLGNLATLHSMRGEGEAAERKLGEALALAGDLGDEKAQSEIYNQMGLLAEERGHYRDALERYRSALSIRMRLDDIWLRAESQNNVGFIYFLLSDYDHSMVYWRSARENFAKAHDPMGEVEVRQNIAQLELQRGNWPEAYRALRTGEKLARRENLEDYEIVIRAYLGRLAFLQGRFRSASEKWDSVSEFMHSRGDRRGIVEFDLWRAELSLALGQLQRAERQLTELAKPLAEYGSVEQRVAEKLLRLQLARERGESQRAEKIHGELDPLLGPEVPHRLGLRARIAAVELGLDGQAALEEVQWEDYPVEQLRWLEVQCRRQRQRGDWSGLQQSLSVARPLLKKVDGYWRSYIFEHLDFLLSQHRGRADLAARASANRFYSNLLEQVADEDRAAFRARNPLPQRLALNH